MKALFSSSFRLARPLTSPSRHSSLVANISKSKAPAHIFISKSSDPFLNLSIEHYIFQNAPPGSRVLLFYTNRPCIVIGRNQNPWLEVNLKRLKTGIPDPELNQQILQHVDLVRRRSGGGTVFHDGGNVNWSVTCDLAEFLRDKHAEMVVRALRTLGIDRARVNQRHDVVLDRGHKVNSFDTQDTHSTAYTGGTPALPPVKVSGSAYKIARNRALHHGTALVGSKNLKVIPQFLHSPAKLCITAKGVESVSSPIANINIDNRDFEKAVEAEFRRLYNADPENIPISIVGEECLAIEDIEKGQKELKSEEWIYLQTPQFDFEVSSADFDRFALSAKHGTISGSTWSPQGPNGTDLDLTDRLQGQQLHKVLSWEDCLQGPAADAAGDSDGARIANLASELERLLPATR